MSLIQSILHGVNAEKDYQVEFKTNKDYVSEVRNPYLPAEWARQGFIQLTWPHAQTDWAYMLQEVNACFCRIAREISIRQPLLIVTPDPEDVKRQLTEAAIDLQQIHFFQCPSNDTWARDHAFITMLSANFPLMLDFTFNGWGLKYAADKDNLINRQLFDAGVIGGRYYNCRGFVLEGGSIESDGKGTLLTTSKCLLSPNRDAQYSHSEIEQYLIKTFHLKRVLWVDYGYLAGDDTDSHIDTLVRICPHDTLVYVKCTDCSDEHYKELLAMETQLQSFKTLTGQPYRLLPLPMADPIIVDGERLPATYANFLIMNKVVLYPTYNQPLHDEEARKVLQEAFPDREIVGIDCRPLICQHGSLHCVTMQYPIECKLSTI